MIKNPFFLLVSIMFVYSCNNEIKPPLKNSIIPPKAEKLPVSLKKLNIDPALASSVFVTTITDVIGFLSFLGLGSIYFLN